MSNFDYTNPYQTPLQYLHPPKQLRLASRLKRFLGLMIDNAALLVSLFPGFAVMIGGLIATDSQSGPDTAALFVLGGIGLMFFGVLVNICIQIYLIAASSQSIGKYFLKMQVIDFHTHQRSPFVQCFLLRNIVGVVLLSQVPLYGIIDACFIFREDHRCLHDLIGNTIVVDLE